MYLPWKVEVGLEVTVGLYRRYPIIRDNYSCANNVAAQTRLNRSGTRREAAGHFPASKEYRKQTQICTSPGSCLACADQADMLSDTSYLGSNRSLQVNP